MALETKIMAQDLVFTKAIVISKQEQREPSTYFVLKTLLCSGDSSFSADEISGGHVYCKWILLWRRLAENCYVSRRQGGGVKAMVATTNRKRKRKRERKNENERENHWGRMRETTWGVDSRALARGRALAAPIYAPVTEPSGAIKLVL